MKFHGREIDPLSFWSRYVEFPAGTKDDGSEFSSLVHCPNPGHDNFRSPAFQINMRHPLVHCFSRCGIEGTWEHAVSVIEGLYEKYDVAGAKGNKREHLHRMSKAHREARRIILRNSKFTTRTRQVVRPVKKVTASKKLDLEYEHYLPVAALEYLDKRGISGAEVAYWDLGWDPDDKRIVIPARDEENRTRFLIERAVDERSYPKYLYSGGSEKTALLFGANKLSRDMKYIVICEGSFDVIRLHQHGVPAVGIMGTGISDAQQRIVARLRPKKIYLMFDRDTSGVRNIEIAYEKLRPYPLLVCRFPKGKSDPAELTREEAWRSLDRAVPILIWRKKLREMA